ncbi:hypothetical protein BS78_03G107200 [Paspalum vaginatum]|nr:hypothetical protein BS78_03G107200 [Paspalum vaginatum]
MKTSTSIRCFPFLCGSAAARVKRRETRKDQRAPSRGTWVYRRLPPHHGSPINQEHNHAKTLLVDSDDALSRSGHCLSQLPAGTAIMTRMSSLDASSEQNEQRTRRREWMS